MLKKSLMIISERSKDDSHLVQEMKFTVDSSEESNKTWTTAKVNDLKNELQIENSRERNRLSDEIKYFVHDNIREIKNSLSPILTFDKNDRYIMIMQKMINDFEMENNKQRTRDSTEFRRVLHNDISKEIKDHLNKFEEFKKEFELHNSEIASNKKKLDEFESKCTNLQTTFLHGGLDIIGELKEKLNGLINQFEGFKNKSEEQFGELKADLKVKQHDISQNSLKIEKRVLELKLKLEGENSKIEENNKSLLHKIKENSQMIIGLRNNSMKLTPKDK